MILVTKENVYINCFNICTVGEVKGNDIAIAVNNPLITFEDAEEKENTSNLLYQVLIDTKKEIQKLSLPVLNSIASNILSDITGGERNKVEITEGFKIEVDSTDVNVIEGSAQVITNLSLRIALLNTFYKDNFLVCLFDEIDESLHEDRFEYMEECFNRLANSGYQIIAVSHKDYSSGNIINLHEVNSDD